MHQLLQRNIAVLPRRQALAFVTRQSQRANQSWAGLLRLDHFVDIAALGRLVFTVRTGHAYVTTSYEPCYRRVCWTLPQSAIYLNT